MDSGVDSLHRRPVLLSSCCLLMAHRSSRSSWARLSSWRGWHEFHRRIPDRAFVGKLRRVFHPHSPGKSRSVHIGGGTRTHRAWWPYLADLLVRALLDVSPQDILANLMSAAMSPAYRCRI